MFYRSVRIDDGKITEVDRTVDASIMGVFLFNVFDVYEPMLESSVKVIVDRLWVKPIGGIARYEGDYYQRVPGDYSGIPGNPWIITTLWVTQYYMAKGDCYRAREFISWVNRVRTSTNLLPEQVDPFRDYLFQ